MSTAISLGSTTLQLPDPGESYSLPLLNQNFTNIANDSKRRTQSVYDPTGGTTWGSIPADATTAAYKILPCSAVGTTDANGYYGVPMPLSFPNGYIVVSCLNGDDWARPSLYFNISTNIFTNTANKFYVRAVQNGSTPLNAGIMRINFLVVGW